MKRNAEELKLLFQQEMVPARGINIRMASIEQ